MTKPLFKWTGGKGRLFDKYEKLGFFPHPDEFGQSVLVMKNVIFVLRKRTLISRPPCCPT